jgi:ThiF family
VSECVYEALSRTALLIDLDVFDGIADRRLIVDGLRATTARIIVNRDNVACAAGQTALVTLYAQLAMTGLQIDLDAPTVALAAPQPPLRGADLVSSLLDYAADLLPGGSSRPSAVPDVVFLLGNTPGPDGSVRVSGGPWTAFAGPRSPVQAWRGDNPVGAVAAAAAAAAEGVRAAIPNIAERLGRQAPREQRWQQLPNRQVSLDLERYRVDHPVAPGEVDLVSGGAITNAALYTLLRVPRLSASMRVIEHDRLTLSNLNRYALARRSMLTVWKAQALASFATDRLQIIGYRAALDDDTAEALHPLAPRLLVGVDHIPSRWAAQRHAALSWVCVGSTSHDYVLVSAHPPGTACAGCVHPRDDPDFTGDIPTISFVSLWAGLAQALELMVSAAGRGPMSARSTHIWPLGLENPRGIHPFPQHATTDCPVGCRVWARPPAT